MSVSTSPTSCKSPAISSQARASKMDDCILQAEREEQETLTSSESPSLSPYEKAFNMSRIAIQEELERKDRLMAKKALQRERPDLYPDPPPHFEPGTTYVTGYGQDKGYYWPCVIYDETKLPLDFNVKKPDHVAAAAIPVLIMGVHELCWCLSFNLIEYVPSSDQINQKSRNLEIPRNHRDEDVSVFQEPANYTLRALVYEEALEFHPLRYFEDCIAAKQAAKDSLRALGFQGPLSFDSLRYCGDRVAAKQLTNGEVSKQDAMAAAVIISDSEEEGMNKRHIDEEDDGNDKKVTKRLSTFKKQAARKETASSKAKKNNKKRAKGNESDTMTEDNLAQPPPKKRKRTTLTDRIPNSLVMPNVLADLNKSVTKRACPKAASAAKVGASAKIRARSDSKIVPGGMTGTLRTEDSNNGSDEMSAEEHNARHEAVRIYIGEGPTEHYHETTMAVVNGLPYFKKRLAIREGIPTPCVRSKYLATMTQKEFAPIGEFIDYGEYTPYLFEDDPPHLDGIKTFDDQERTALDAGELWVFAKKLQLIELMELIQRKILAQWPLDSDTLITFTRLVYYTDDSGLEVEATMRTTLQEEIASRFYSLMMSDSVQLLTKLMKTTPEIAGFVGQTFVDDAAAADAAAAAKAGYTEVEDED